MWAGAQKWVVDDKSERWGYISLWRAGIHVGVDTNLRGSGLVGGGWRVVGCDPMRCQHRQEGWPVGAGLRRGGRRGGLGRAWLVLACLGELIIG